MWGDVVVPIFYAVINLGSTPAFLPAQYRPHTHFLYQSQCQQMHASKSYPFYFLHNLFPVQYHIPVIRLNRLSPVSLKILTLHRNVSHAVIAKSGCKV